MIAYITVTPVGKPRMTQSDVWRQRPAVLRYRHYCDELQAALPGYVLPGRLTVIFYLPLPRSWSRKRRAAMDGQPHQGKPDIDNLLKAFMDAGKAEDEHVYAVNAQKYWAETGAIEVIQEELYGKENDR